MPPVCRLGVTRVPQFRRWCRVEVGQKGFAGSAGDGEGAEPAPGIGDEMGPGRSLSEVQQNLSAGPRDRGRDSEDAQAEPFGFPPAGFMVGEGEELGPGVDLSSQADDGAPDLVFGRSHATANSVARIL